VWVENLQDFNMTFFFHWFYYCSGHLCHLLVHGLGRPTVHPSTNKQNYVFLIVYYMPFDIHSDLLA
jgi:hypothetical protein